MDKDLLLFLLLKAKVNDEIFCSYEFYENFEYDDGYGGSSFYSEKKDFPITTTKLWEDFLNLLAENSEKAHWSFIDSHASGIFVFKKEEHNPDEDRIFIEKKEYERKKKELEEEYREYYKNFKIKYDKMLSELIDILKKENNAKI